MPLGQQVPAGRLGGKPGADTAPSDEQKASLVPSYEAEDSTASSASAEAKQGGKAAPPQPPRGGGGREGAREVPGEQEGGRPQLRERRARENARMRQGMKTGDERYLGPRPGSGSRSFVRDRVDSRLCMAEFLLPLLVIMVMQYSGNATLQGFSNGLWSATIILVLVDTVLLVIKLKRELKKRFGDEGTKARCSTGSCARCSCASCGCRSPRSRSVSVSPSARRSCGPGAAPPAAWRARVGTMEIRNLGSSGLKISAIAYGNWLTHGSQVEEDAALACVRQALEEGITTFDTADVYANTAAETVLGKALKDERREGLEIFTKVYWPTPAGTTTTGSPASTSWSRSTAP